MTDFLTTGQAQDEPALHSSLSTLHSSLYTIHSPLSTIHYPLSTGRQPPLSLCVLHSLSKRKYLGVLGVLRESLFPFVPLA